jgi:hypothetical protein
MRRSKKHAVALVGQGFRLASSKNRVLSSAAVKHSYSRAIDRVSRRKETIGTRRILERVEEWNA